jgi:hypothetical protein
MTDAAADWRTVVSTMAAAYHAGDNARGEELLGSALDLGAPWDVITAAAAQALIECPSRQAIDETGRTLRGSG